MKNTTKKLLSLLLCAVMLCSLLPVSAFAGEDPICSLTVEGTTTNYKSLQTAIDNAKDNTECTIKMLYQCQLSSGQTITIPAAKKIKLNLDTFSVYNSSFTNTSPVITCKGTLTVTAANSTVMIGALSGPAVVVDGGKLYFNEGSLFCGQGDIITVNSGTAEINGGSHTGSISCAGTLTINGGSFNNVSPNKFATTGNGKINLCGGMYINSPPAGFVDVDSGYAILPSGDSTYKYKVEAHTSHSWTYSLKNGTNDTVTASCPCGTPAQELTISAPTDAAYDGNSHNASFGTAESFCGEALPGITYQYKSTLSGTYASVSDTKNAGYYKASFTVGGVTAFVEYQVTGATQTIAVPTVNLKESTKVTLNAVAAGQGATKYAYSTSKTAPDTGWQDGVEFTGLTPDTTYYFFAKYEGNNNYKFEVSDGLVVKTPKHTHAWSYALTTVTSDNDTVTATCANADGNHEGDNPDSLTIVAPASCVYDGNSSHDASFGTAASFCGSTALPEITYEYKATRNEAYAAVTDTTARGYYKASFSVGGVTAFVEYQVYELITSVAFTSVTLPIDGTKVETSMATFTQEKSPSVSVDSNGNYSLGNQYYWKNEDGKDEFSIDAVGTYFEGTYAEGDTFYIFCLLLSDDGYSLDNITKNDIAVPDGITVEFVVSSKDMPEADPGLLAVILSGKVVSKYACTLTIGNGTPAYHTTVQDAIDAAGTSEATVKLLKSVQESILVGKNSSGYIDQNITLDLNGYALSAEKGCSVIKNYSTLVIKDSNKNSTGKITGGNADYGGGIYNCGTLTVESGSITGNSATYGGGIYNYGGICNITGGSISGNSASLGGGIFNEYYSTYYPGSLTVSGGSITGNTAKETVDDTGIGGGIYNAGGTCTVTGSGSVTGNTAELCGGGICNTLEYYYLTHSGSLTVSGNGIIRENKAALFGGGIFNAAALTVSGGKICSNSACIGGGIANGGSSSFEFKSSSTYMPEFTMTGGEISGNTAQAGGGVNCESGTFEISGGSITGNNAVYNSSPGDGGYAAPYDGLGGGVCICSGYYTPGQIPEFTMNGGEISGNTSAWLGGGIATFCNGKTNLLGGTITGNKVTTAFNGYYCGGGVAVCCSSSSDDSLNTHPVTLGGSIVITGNTDGAGNANNLSLHVDSEDDMYCEIFLNGLKKGANIGVNIQADPAVVCPVAITGTCSKTDMDYFVSDVSGLSVVYDSTSQVLKLGDFACSLTVGEAVTYHSSVQSAINAAKTSEGTVTLLKDWTGSTTVASGQNITLDLNGHTLGGYYILIQNNGTLTIADSSESQVGKISRERDFPDVTAIINTGTLIFQNGNIKVLADNSMGISNTGTVTINGGSIQVDGASNSNCIESLNGGKVIIHGGSFRAISTYRISAIPAVLYTEGESSSIEVDGGIFNLKPDDSYLAEGYEVISNPDTATSGDYPYAVVPIGIPLSGEFTGSFFADGEPVEKEVIGGITYVKVPGSGVKVLTYYEYTTGTGEGTDAQRTYPVSMKVWLLSYDAQSGKYTATEFTELENALTYCGTSIRTSGNKGIRVITGINETLKGQLIAGLKGWTLTEYGTVIAWTSQLGSEGLTLEASGAQHNYAYSKAAGTDPVFNKVNGMVQYTNVLILKDLPESAMGMDITMRPYMKLTDSQGNEIVVYGGEIVRSIGYVAYQNRNEFTPGTSEYKYIWAMIHAAYGDTYDSEYKVK